MNKKIVASLRYGRVNPWPLNLLWAAIAVFGVAFLIIMSLISLPEKDWAAFAIEVIGGLLFAFFGFYGLIRDLFIRSKIKLWQADAVKLSAKTNEADFDYSRFCVAIAVRFEYHDKKMRKVSGRHGHLNYDPVFLKYRNRKINILYSPKYDEVMILKD